MNSILWQFKMNDRPGTFILPEQGVRNDESDWVRILPNWPLSKCNIISLQKNGKGQVESVQLQY